jgi:hypothetical protein
VWRQVTPGYRTQVSKAAIWAKNLRSIVKCDDACPDAHR